eukprot:249942_1
MKPTESLSRQFVLSLFKEQANRLNYECQQFQAELRSFISTSSDDSCINEKLSKVLDNYSTSLNKICVQYLIKLESQLQPSSTQPSANPNPTRPYSCSLCDISYTTRSSLLRHNRKNHLHTQSSGDENDDSSSNDSDSDVSSLSLAQHEREFKCDICDRCFRRAQDLTRHKAFCMKKLSNAFKCDICERVFEKASRLAYHKTSHSDSRPFKCEDCTADFKLHHYLVQHIFRVHKKNPWKCNECPQAFRLKKELRKHMESDHQQKAKDNDQTETTDTVNENETNVNNWNRINAINNQDSDASDSMDVDEVIPGRHNVEIESDKANSIYKTPKQTKCLFNRRL